MLAHTVLTSKNVRSAGARLGTHIFIDLHANGNYSLVIHECTVHSHVSLDNDIRP